MIQRINDSTYNRKPPQKFIPRRDLFPDAEPPLSGKSTEDKKPSDRRPAKKESGEGSSTSAQQAREPSIHTNRIPVEESEPLPLQQPLKPVRKQSRTFIPPTTFFLLLIGWFLLWPRMKKTRTRWTYDMQSMESAFENLLDNPKNVEMLHAICPFLEEQQQDAVYTITGILDALSSIRSALNHTYPQKIWNSAVYVPSDPDARRIELMKAIKPYVEPNNQRKLDQIIGTCHTVDQLNRSVLDYQNRQSMTDGQKTSPTESFGEILGILRPILPQEFGEKADQLMQILKIAQTMESANKESRKEEKEEDTADKEQQTEDTANRKQQTPPSAPMNDKQKESMEMMVRMAQLLAQTKDSSDTGSGADPGTKSGKPEETE